MTTDRTASTRRSSLLRKNILASFLVKGWSGVVLLLLVPVTLKCLGDYANGVWLTISSMLMWIDNMDIGLGNGLRNKLSAHLAHNETERARALISSTFAMLTCVMLPTATILLALIYSADTYGFLNVSPEKIGSLDNVLAATVMLVCTTFVLKLLGNFYMGLQLPAVNNLLVTAGQTIALLLTWLVYLSGSHSLMLVAIANTAAPLLVYALAFPYTFLHKYPHLRPSLRLISLREGMEVMNMGVRFFVMQMSAIVLFMSANILISKLFSPAMVTPYQITYRYFSLLLVLFSVICTPYWNATTDAYERNDLTWIRNANKRLTLVTAGIALCATVMVAASGLVYNVWIGDSVDIDIRMTVAMAAYVFTLVYSQRYSYLLNGIGALKLQLVFTSTAAILFIPLAWLAVALTHDVVWFMAVMCLVNVPGMVVNRIQFNKIIHQQATGIWIQ